MEAALDWIATYGYSAIFVLLVLGIVGLPVPDETLLVFSGYLVFKKRLDLPLTLLSAAAGSICGITCSYLLGRWLGLPLIHSKIGRWAHISDRQIGRVHDWFNRLGHWTLFAGYFIPGVRHFTALIAGTSCLEYRPFALYAYSGAIFWVSTFIFVGLRFGDQWQRVLAAIEGNLKVAMVLGAVLALAYLGFVYSLRKRRR